MRMGSRTKEVRKILREASKEGWVVRVGGTHLYLEREGVKIPFSCNPGSDKAIIAMRLRIKKGAM